MIGSNSTWEGTKEDDDLDMTRNKLQSNANDVRQIHSAFPEAVDGMPQVRVRVCSSTGRTSEGRQDCKHETVG